MRVTGLPGTARGLRELIRKGGLIQPTSGMLSGYVQANLVVLPRNLAFEFLLYCQRNPKPCPLLDVVEAGGTEPTSIALGSDIRFDVPLYRIFQDGVQVAEVEEVSEYWRDDLVSFLLGCSFSFESALIEAGISIRHIDQGTNVPMYITNIPTRPAGIFNGPMVVSMRPIPMDDIVRTVQVTSRFPTVHGAPVHIGNPEIIGLKDLSKPHFGDCVEIRANEVPVFWACGVTPQVAAVHSKPPLMITHAPGHMFITDIRDAEVSVI